MHAIARRTISRWKVVAIAFVLAGATASGVHAQDTLAATTVQTVHTEEEDSDFPWGLPGLLGPAGLLNRGKEEEVHVHREPVRPVDTHRPASGPVVDRTVVRPDDHHGTGGTTDGGTRL